MLAVLEDANNAALEAASDRAVAAAYAVGLISKNGGLHLENHLYSLQNQHTNLH